MVLQLRPDFLLVTIITIGVVGVLTPPTFKSCNAVDYFAKCCIVDIVPRRAILHPKPDDIAGETFWNFRV